MKISAAQEFLEKQISSPVLITAGLLSIPAFLLQNSLVLQAAQVVLFTAAALLAGKRVRLLPPLIILVSVSALHVVTPVGRVLLSLGRFSLTSGSLYLGIHKSLTLIGLIFLSRATVRPDLVLPGRFGAVISRSFYFFDRIQETWETVPKGKIIPRLDAVLEKISKPEAAGGRHTDREDLSAGQGRNRGGVCSGDGFFSPGETTVRGFILAGFFTAVQWVLFALQYTVEWDLI